jgi:hybrid polyketide synthase/nonribosomal peptide synthetase ACE1
VPRLRLNSNRNDRYNSARRLIIKEVPRAQSTVAVQPTEKGYLVEEKDTRTSPSFRIGIEVHVTHSLLRAARLTETSSLFLVVGKNVQNNEHVLALTHTLDSQVYVPHGLALRCGESEEQSIRSMLTLYVHLFTLSMFQNIQAGDALAVLDPDFSLSPLLTKYANEKGVQLVLLTTKEGHRSWPWVQIHPNSTKRELTAKLPSNISRLVNMGESEEVLHVLKSCFKSNCQFENETTLTTNRSRSDYLSDMSQIATQLQNSWIKAQYDLTPVNLHRFATLGLQDLIRAQETFKTQSLLTWDQSKLAVQVQPATKHVKFSKDKTYWLIGLTGGLGLSLCQWMIRQGARFIALSSRNPKIDDAWLARMAAAGCTVRVFPK